jgi:hypothetical protein
MEFQTWSNINKEALRVLRPPSGSVSWDKLTFTDKNKIWQYLYRDYFFDKTPRYPEYVSHSGENEKAYHFEGDPQLQEIKRRRILWTVHQLNERFKKQSFGKNTLEVVSWFNTCLDFHTIFMKAQGHAVLEMLSIFCKDILISDRSIGYGYPGESKKAFKERLRESRLKEFDDFAATLNEVFAQFGLDVYLTRGGFMPMQEMKLIEMVYAPVLSCFTDPQWKKVNDLISLAFKEYEKKTSEGFSFCITTTVSAVQAFLQIMVHGETGEEQISKLIPKAQKLNKIPSDHFSTTIFNNIESILARERKDKGVAHPPQSVADEKSALLMLNIAMVFFQHCIVTPS